MGDDVTASDEDEKSDQMMGDEEQICREEDEVVQQIHEKVGDAVIEDGVLKIGVG